MKSTRVIGLLLLVIGVGLWSSAIAEPGPAKSSSQSAALVNLTLKDVSVKQAIDKIFEGRKLSYVVEPGITGTIKELTLKGITLDQALKSLGDAAGFTYEISDNIYVISPIKPVAVKAPVSTYQSAPAQAQGPPPAAYPEPPPVAPAPANSGNAVIVEQNAPVFYGHPGPYPDTYAYAGGYGSPYYYGPYPPFGVGSVVVGGEGGTVVIPGGGLVGPGYVYPPPPPGWVSPEMLRFLRNQWAFSRHRAYPPYGY